MRKEHTEVLLCKIKDLKNYARMFMKAYRHDMEYNFREDLETTIAYCKDFENMKPFNEPEDEEDEE